MKTQHVGFILLAVTITGAAAWWFTLRDTQTKQITTLEGEVQTAQNSATLRQTQEAEASTNLLTTTDELHAMQTELDAITARIPTGIDFTPLILLINNLTDQHLLQHDGITETNREQLTSEMFTVTYSLTTTGTFDDQMRFLTDIHNQGRLMVIESVTLNSRAGATPNEPMITLNLTLHTFTRGVLPTEQPEEEPA